MSSRASTVSRGESWPVRATSGARAARQPWSGVSGMVSLAGLGGAGAALAGGSHYVIQGHGPENLGHPLWGARAFLRLCARTALGTVAAEIPPE